MHKPLGWATTRALRRGDIPDEHFRRVIMWMDVNSPQYGAFTHIREQWNGDLIWPEVDVDAKNLTGVERDRELP